MVDLMGLLSDALIGSSRMKERRMSRLSLREISGKACLRLIKERLCLNFHQTKVN